MKNSSFKFLALVSLLAMGNATFAASTWDLNASCGTSGNGGETTVVDPNNANNTASYLTTGACGNGSNSGTTLNVGGWATTAGTGNAAYTIFGATAALVYDWGAAGLGIVNGNEKAFDTGPHAADNAMGTDMFLLKFGAAVNLTGLNIGWNGTDNPTLTNNINYKDSDLSVFAWVGNGAPGAPPTLAGQNISVLSGGTSVTSGWKLIGNYADVGVNSNNAQTLNATNNNGTALYSSYWMVSAYNPVYGGSKVDAYGEGTPANQFTDAFKLLLLAADPCTSSVSSNQCSTNVPEPGALVLFGAGLLGLFASRRKSLFQRSKFVSI